MVTRKQKNLIIEPQFETLSMPSPVIASKPFLVDSVFRCLYWTITCIMPFQHCHECGIPWGFGDILNVVGTKNLSLVYPSSPALCTTLPPGAWELGAQLVDHTGDTSAWVRYPLKSQTIRKILGLVYKCYRLCLIFFSNASTKFKYWPHISRSCTVQTAHACSN